MKMNKVFLMYINSLYEIMLVTFLSLLLSNSHENFDGFSYMKIDSNFYARYTYGNKGFKLIHWNPGSSFLENKIDELESLIQEQKPMILGISESNLFQHHDLSYCSLKNYELITADTISNPAVKVSRVVVYKHESITAKVRHDLMDPRFSSIWLEIHLSKNKKFLLCNLYREHQYLRQSDNSSLSSEEQIERWGIFLEQWEKALETNMECIVMGDSNVDHLMIDSNELTKSKHKPFIDMLINKILPYGVRQCVSNATHFRPGAKESLIDICYTNDPDRLASVQAIPRGPSEHRLIMAVRHSKVSQEKHRYTKKRTYKHFNENTYLNELRQCKWWDVYSSNDVNRAVELFTEKISNILDRMAPIKIFQNRNNFAGWLSQKTKDKMKERDSLLKKASTTKQDSDWKHYRKIRNEVTGMQRNDKQEWKKQSLRSCKGDHGKIWKNVLGWVKDSAGGPPSKLYNNGMVESSPKMPADIMNNFNINKIKTFRMNLPPPSADPLA